MTFANPFWSLLLLLVPLVWFLPERKRSRAVIRFPSAGLLEGIRPTFWQRLAWLPRALRVACLVLLIVALARPQRPNQQTRVYAEGIAIQMVVDRSISMYAPDFELNGKPATRLDAAKDVFQRFVEGDGKLEGRPDDLIGLVTFANFPDVKCPLTLSHEAVLHALSGVRPGLGSEGGTNIGDSVAWALEDLRGAKAKSKVMILLTDGVNEPQRIQGMPEPLDPVEAARVAQGLGVKIYTIGVGKGAGRFRMRDPDSGEMLMAHADPVNETMLRQMAETSGGQFYRATDTEGLRQIYGEIDRLEKTRSESVVYLDYKELFPPLAWAGMAMLCVEQLLVTTRLRRIP